MSRELFILSSEQKEFKNSLKPGDLPLEFYYGDYLYSKWYDGLFHIHPKETPLPVWPLTTRPLSMVSISEAANILIATRHPKMLELARARNFTF